MKDKFKKAIVTGGAGFIGSHLVERLVDMGIDTLSVDDYSTGKIKNLIYDLRTTIYFFECGLVSLPPWPRVGI